ncbi:MAG: TatD family hydrolase [Planctomycetes bacterium]|nr:TatD family hydrolase [Planctomycetota bacterium]
MIFDTHCHLRYGGADAAAIVARAAAAGVTQLLDVGIDAASSTLARDTARALTGVGWSAGLHPNDARRLAEEFPAIEALVREGDCRAVGETGLDFYRDWTPPDQQERALLAHLELARRAGLPVILHCRDAFARLFALLAPYAPLRGVMHCFSGGPDEARTALDLGLHLSFAGPLTYPKSDALRAAARSAPLDRILVETDAPFLPPQGWRGQKNEPAYLVATVARLAAERGSSPDAIAAATTANARALFAM